MPKVELTPEDRASIARCAGLITTTFTDRFEEVSEVEVDGGVYNAVGDIFIQAVEDAIDRACRG